MQAVSWIIMVLLYYIQCSQPHKAHDRLLVGTAIHHCYLVVRKRLWACTLHNMFLRPKTIPSCWGASIRDILAKKWVLVPNGQSQYNVRIWGKSHAHTKIIYMSFSYLIYTIHYTIALYIMSVEFVFQRHVPVVMLVCHVTLEWWVSL